MLHFANISLIGMHGTGKSTVGVLLAKALTWSFLDTDLMIQVAEECSVREMIRTEGIERFVGIEQRHILALNRRRHVIAAGGSVVCGGAAIEHLKSLGPVVHLDLPLPVVERRLAGLNGQGIVLGPGQTIAGIFQHRDPLYRRYADLTVECVGRTQEEIVDEILAGVC